MNNEPIWAIEFYKLYEDRNIEQLRSSLFKVSDVLIYLNEILTEHNVKLADKEVYSEQLIIKFYLQNLSLITLSKGIEIKSNYHKNNFSKIKFLDISSILTIVRSQYETLLMYQHIYVNSKIENQQKLRFDSWIMSSMILRSKIFSETQNNNQSRLLEEKNAIENLREIIKNNPEFQFLTEKQKVKLLEVGSGKLFKSWENLFYESNFTEDGVFSKIYYIASVYAHSEGISALQLKNSKHLMDDENMREIKYIMLYYSYLMTNIMIKNIVNKFPIIKERFDTLEERLKFEVNFNYQLSFKKSK